MRRYDDAMDLDDEATMLARYREAREQAMFPDEIDTPQDVAASVRFQKYVRHAAKHHSMLCIIEYTDRGDVCLALFPRHHYSCCRIVLSVLSRVSVF